MKIFFKLSLIAQVKTLIIPYDNEEDYEYNINFCVLFLLLRENAVLRKEGD